MSEGRGFDSRWCHRNFSLTYSFRPHCVPGVDSASNRNEYQDYFLVVKVAGEQDCQTYHLRVPIVFKSGNLNLLETSGSVQAFNGIVLFQETIFTSVSTPTPIPQRQKHVPHFDKHLYLKYIHFISLYIVETTKIISFSSVMHFHTTRKKIVLLKSYICSLSLCFPCCFHSLYPLSVPPTPIPSIT